MSFVHLTVKQLVWHWNYSTFFIKNWVLFG